MADSLTMHIGGVTARVHHYPYRLEAFGNDQESIKRAGLQWPEPRRGEVRRVRTLRKPIMYAIIEKRYISGIFEQETAARDYMHDIPEATRSQHILTRLDEMKYPVYIVEDAAGFRFMRKAAALEDITTRAPSSDDDDCLMTLYRVDDDYRPRVAGDDEMGRLAHEHITNELLARVQVEGRAALWIMSDDE